MRAKSAGPGNQLPLICVSTSSQELAWRFPSVALAGIKTWGRTVIVDPTNGEKPPTETAVLIGDPNTGLSRADLKRLPDLLAYIRVGDEILNVDLVACDARGVQVHNTPGCFDRAVGEFVIAVAVNLTRGITHSNRSLLGSKSHRRWTLGRGLSESTFGVIGVGSIGRHVARLAQHLGATVIGHDPYVRDTDIDMGSLDDVLTKSDVVSLHATASPVTYHLIGGQELALMGPTSFLINTARGSLVDEDALLAAIRDGKIAGAALDVFDDETDVEQHPLAREPNVLATAHLAGFTADAYCRQALVAAELAATTVRSQTLQRGTP